METNMRRCSLAVLLLVATAASAAPRISFVRRVPAAHDLAPAERVAVIYAIGDSDKVLTFVDRFVDVVTRAGKLRITNAVENNHHFATIDVAALRHDHPADAYLGVNVFTCSGIERSAEGSEHDVDGGRIKRTHHWIDATCTARVDVLGRDGRKLFSYHVRGEGTSPRATTLSDDEKDVAYDQAARYAANVAAEGITPRAGRGPSARGALRPPPRSPSAADRFGTRPATWKRRGATSRPPSNSRRKRLATRASC